MIINELTIKQLNKAAYMLCAIAHPTRIAILSFLVDDVKRTIAKILKKKSIELSTVSHRLGILRENGVLISIFGSTNSYHSFR
jgi:DNA-binding transcriptional ArsR family regulator